MPLDLGFLKVENHYEDSADDQLSQDTGYLADIIVQLCLHSYAYDEFEDDSNDGFRLEEERVNVFAACKTALEVLRYPEEKKTETNDDEIQEKIDVLINMRELIVIFDAIEDSVNLEDAIADAMLKGIYYRRKDHHRSCAEELKWCLVRFSLWL
ncbi:unnamed protein product [Sphagnum troendelagicum]|uniref:Uncharacterized protein n=1 Tax=Sphagnum troendelagicum TaxID=128251 RepID=A0ABP0T6T0_9BRYO